MDIIAALHWLQENIGYVCTPFNGDVDIFEILFLYILISVVVVVVFFDRAFGGDKDSVTLAGHSTGAACVHYLMTSNAVPEGK